MTLLKNDGSLPAKIDSYKILAWPIERRPEGLGISINDGWCFGIGFGMAMLAIPLILILAGFILAIVLTILGAL